MKNMSIGRKLGAAFAFLFALMLVVGLTGFRSLNVTADLARSLILVDAPLTEESREAEARTLGLRRFEKDLFLNIGSADKEAEYLTKWNEQFAKLQERLDTMERLAQSDEERSTVKTMRRDALTYRDGLHRVAAQIRDGSIKTPQQANAAIASVKDPIRTLGDGAAAFADAHSQAMTTREKDVDGQVHASATRMLILLLVAATVSLVVAVVMIRGLTRDIGAAVHHVQSSSTQLQAAANQQATASKEQAAATNETTTTIRELVATARQIAESAQRVAQIAQQTAAGAENGAQTVRKAQDGLGTIKRQVDVIVGHMLELGRKSQQIGGILDIINELAEQTNILSINATIEAAGAGEAGKRFSVVADEIRKLADRVGGSTKDIRTLIEEIRTAVNTTVMATEQGTKAVEQGSRQVGDVATAFTQIATMVETTTEAAREIELSTKQQTTAVEQVSIAMGNVVLAAKESEASSSETLQTAVQLNTLSRDLTRLIRAQA